MIFWMLYANEVKGGIARLFFGDRAGQVARRILDDAEKNVEPVFWHPCRGKSLSRDPCGWTGFGSGVT